MKKTDVSLIVPCYNEGSTFESSVNKIIKQLKNSSRKWELIFIEDKSEDETKRTVEKFVKNSTNIRSIYHSKNQGRGKSVADGLLIARGEISGYIDVDLEISEKYIPIFIKDIEEGYDLVVGKRFYESGFNSIIRVIVSKVYVYVIKFLINIPLSDTESGYKFFRTKNILKILPKIKSKHWFWDTEICAYSHDSGLKIGEIPVIYQRRVEKQSTVRLIPDTLDYIKNIIRLRSQLSN